MWFLWRMLRISWAAKILNETVLRGADITRSLVSRIHKLHTIFCGNVIRRVQHDKFCIRQLEPIAEVIDCLLCEH